MRRALLLKRWATTGVGSGLVMAVAAVLSAVAPATPVPISPGQPIQALVDAHPAGTSFLLKAGVHRMQHITPKDRDSFAGERGAILSGAKMLTAFKRAGGSYWMATGLTGDSTSHGRCEAGYAGCAYSNDLFFDDVPFKHVLTLAEVVPGTWFFDYSAGCLYLSDDPTGHQVELSVTPDAFAGPANFVTISNLIIEKYANPAQHGAIHGDGTTGWVVQNSEVRRTHGVGVRAGDGWRILDNTLHHNGQMGLGGARVASVTVDRNEIAYNNGLHFDAEWEAGGAKFTETRDLTMHENHSHHNRGPGLWTDIDNINTTYDHNLVEDNDDAGIYHEISYAAVIRHNITRRNGFGRSTWLWGAGILIAASRDVEVFANTVENNANGIGAVQQRRGSGRYGPHEVTNLWVHDNRVTMETGRTGLAQDVGDASYFTKRNNRFDANIYTLGSKQDYFEWMDGHRTFSEWRAYHQDGNGAMTLRRRLLGGLTPSRSRASALTARPAPIRLQNQMPPCGPSK